MLVCTDEKMATGWENKAGRVTFLSFHWPDHDSCHHVTLQEWINDQHGNDHDRSNSGDERLGRFLGYRSSRSFGRLDKVRRRLGVFFELGGFLGFYHQLDLLEGALHALVYIRQRPCKNVNQNMGRRLLTYQRIYSKVKEAKGVTLVASLFLKLYIWHRADVGERKKGVDHVTTTTSAYAWKRNHIYKLATAALVIIPKNQVVNF